MAKLQQETGYRMQSTLPTGRGEKDHYPLPFGDCKLFLISFFALETTAPTVDFQNIRSEHMMLFSLYINQNQKQMFVTLKK
jgi:hypothetical protein